MSGSPSSSSSDLVTHRKSRLGLSGDPAPFWTSTEKMWQWTVWSSDGSFVVLTVVVSFLAGGPRYMPARWWRGRAVLGKRLREGWLWNGRECQFFSRKFPDSEMPSKGGQWGLTNPKAPRALETRIAKAAKRVFIFEQEVVRSANDLLGCVSGRCFDSSVQYGNLCERCLSEGET